MRQQGKMGLAGILALIVSGGYVLAVIWPTDSAIPRMLITALLLAANTSLMWRVIRLNRFGRAARGAEKRFALVQPTFKGLR